MSAVSPIPPPLTPKQTETVMQQLTIKMLGLPDNAWDLVRVGWQIQGQPTGKITDDIVYVRAIEDDDEYNRQRDVTTNQKTPSTLQQLTTYVRVWRVMWTLMGPNSFDRARQIKSALFTQTPHDLFAVLNVKLYLVTDISAPRRVPEFIAGQWWERVDFECQFNELVTEEVLTNAVASAEVIVETDKGVQRDIVVSVP